MNSEWPTSPDELRNEYESATARHGKSRAIAAMASTYGVSARTAHRRLVAAGLRTLRARPQRPSPDDLRSAYESACAQHGPRGAISAMAMAYGVEYVSVREWLIEAGLRTVKSRIPPRPITTPCPCGAVATTRYKDEDPPLCYRCYMRRYASDPDSAFRRHGRLTVAAAKKDQPCTDCGGVFPPCVMDFDHVPERGPKLFDLGRSDRSLKAIAEELAKCDIVCANCHRIRTWERRRGQASQPAL